jgi:hypothetical protein
MSTTVARASDNEFVRAVASARSWRSLARAVGLKGTSAGTIRALKRRAARLGIDTSHFTGQRTWSENALRAAVAAADSWSGVTAALGLSDGDRVRVIVKGHAVRLSLDIAHLEPSEHVVPCSFNSLRPDASMLRLASEAFAAAWFAVRGRSPAVPIHPAPYDLLVTFPDGVKRVQVKTTTYRAPSGSWTVGIGRRPYALDATASREPYDPDELDYFFVIDGDAVVYLIPSEVVAGRSAINVGAYAAYRVGDASSLFTT